MRYFGISDKGIARHDNQDAFGIEYLNKHNQLVAVLCDGMGGQNAGAFASDISVHSFLDYTVSKLTSRIIKNPDIKSILLDACSEANKTAYEYSLFDSNFVGMGTTLVGAVISGDGLANVVNVGDSRCYHISREEIKQVTTDHSLVEDLVRAGTITREQAKNHKQKSIITKAVGSEELVSPDYFEVRLKSGDMLLLCSDGLTNYVSDDYIFDCYKNSESPEAFSTMMLNETYMNGAGDNVSIIAVMF